MVNQFKETTYDCGPALNGSHHCMYLSNLAQQGKVNGTAVLETYGYSQDPEQVWYWVGIWRPLFSATDLLQWWPFSGVRTGNRMGKIGNSLFVL